MKIENKNKIFAYWLDKTNQVTLIMGSDILSADKAYKDLGFNPIASVLKTLKVTFSDLRNNKVKWIHPLGKDGKPVKSPYPSIDVTELINSGEEKTTYNIQSTDDLSNLIKGEHTKHHDIISVWCGNVHMFSCFTVGELNKKLQKYIGNKNES